MVTTREEEKSKSKSEIKSGFYSEREMKTNLKMTKSGA